MFCSCIPKSTFSTKQLAEPELSCELRTWEFFSINKVSILVKQNTIFSENKYPSYTGTWFLFFMTSKIDTLHAGEGGCLEVRKLWFVSFRKSCDTTLNATNTQNVDSKLRSCEKKHSSPFCTVTTSV